MRLMPSRRIESLNRPRSLVNTSERRTLNLESPMPPDNLTASVDFLSDAQQWPQSGIDALIGDRSSKSSQRHLFSSPSGDSGILDPTTLPIAGRGVTCNLTDGCKGGLPLLPLVKTAEHGYPVAQAANKRGECWNP